MKTPLSYQEKRAIVTLISSTLILALYAFTVFQRHQDKILNDPNDLSFWGTAVLILIPISIVAQIIVHILFVIFNKIITNEDDPGITDELDKLIELKATRNANWTFIIGFFLSMGILALEMQPYIMILTMVLSGYIAAMFGEITKIYFYRRGF